MVWNKNSIFLPKNLRPYFLFVILSPRGKCNSSTLPFIYLLSSKLGDLENRGKLFFRVNGILKLIRFLLSFASQILLIKFKKELCEALINFSCTNDIRAKARWKGRFFINFIKNGALKKIVPVYLASELNPNVIRGKEKRSKTLSSFCLAGGASRGR